MADIKWIKITTDMFENRKIKYLRRLPDGNNIVLLWVMLLTMAGRYNAGGIISFTENIPYTVKMLADELGFEEATVQMGLAAMEQLDMISVNDGFLVILGWEEYQNTEGMDKIREQNRLRKQRQRERERQLVGGGNVTSRDSHATDKEETEDKEELEDKEKKKAVSHQLIADMYNDICVSLPRIQSVSGVSEKAIKASLMSYSVDDFRNLFAKAEDSDFLKGHNAENWTATFAWLVKESNMAKVLDGRYDNFKGGKNNGTIGQSTGGNFGNVI